MMFEPANKSGSWAAAKADPLAEYRIPVLDRNEPSYMVGFDVESEARPTDREIELIVSFTKFERSRLYTESAVRQMAAKAFDYCDGHNTVLLRKYGPESWGYRRWTWTQTPFFVPDPHIQNPPEDLLTVLDRAAVSLAGWAQWKADRPLFARPVLGTGVPADAVEIACRRAYGEDVWGRTTGPDRETKLAWMRYALEGAAPLLGDRPAPAKPTRAQVRAALENALFRRGVDQHFHVEVLADFVTDDMMLLLAGAEPRAAKTVGTE